MEDFNNSIEVCWKEFRAHISKEGNNEFHHGMVVRDEQAINYNDDDDDEVTYIIIDSYIYKLATLSFLAQCDWKVVTSVLIAALYPR